MNDVMVIDERRRGPLRPLSVAPMMGWTDRHFRRLIRLFTRHTLLYTELIPVGAVLSGSADRALAFSPVERPLALQLGGDDPVAVAECAAIAEGHGFDEVNLNAGCPSERVQHGGFGAALMTRPARVAEMVVAMRRATRLPVTVKHRIGVAPNDRVEDLIRFVDTLAAAGADRVIVHARAAELSGRMSPKQNRRVPLLRPEAVFALKRAHPDLAVEYNGEVRDLDGALRYLRGAGEDAVPMDGVMIGRAACAWPALFADADVRIFGAGENPLGDPPIRPLYVVRAFLPYLCEEAAAGAPLRHAARHLQHVFAGAPGARAWRRALNTLLRDPNATPAALEELACRL